MVQTLALNILPEVNTVLHKITKNYEFMKKFVACASKEDEKPFHFPFIENLEGMTPLHMCLGKPGMMTRKDQGESCDKDQKQNQNREHSESEADFSNSINTRVAEFFLSELLPEMPLDHHGRAIADVIPECITRSIPGLGEYLDKRF